MPINLKGRSLISLKDWTTKEVEYVLELSLNLKNQKRTGIDQSKHFATNKNIVVVMEKDSTRTRSSFETGAYDLGMNVTYMGPSGSHIGGHESVEDTAKVLGRFYDGIAFRGFKNSDVETLAKHSGVPVWNALTDKWHPTQMFADYLTIRERFGTKKIKFAFFGDASSNMGNSLTIMAAHMGVDFWSAAPKEYWPSKEIIAEANEIAKNTGASINFTESAEEAATNADVIYTDVWVSMGEADEIWNKRIKDLLPYQVNSKLMSFAKPDGVFMHCLPAWHNTDTTVGLEIKEKFGLSEIEVTDEVFQSNQSIVFDQAENRGHTIKAIMAATLS